MGHPALQAGCVGHLTREESCRGMAQGFCRFPCLSAAEAERRQAGYMVLAATCERYELPVYAQNNERIREPGDRLFCLVFDRILSWRLR